MAENKNTTENNKNSGIAENNEQLWERIMEKTQDEFLDDSEENSEKIEEIEDLKNDIRNDRYEHTQRPTRMYVSVVAYL